MAYRLGFVMEQTLGHVTHGKNFQQYIANDPDVIATWIPVSYEIEDRWNKVPVVSRNWTLKASIRAREQVVEVLRSTKLDGLFFHTQVTAIFARALMADIPTVVSMDATPINFDKIGSPYDHRPSRFAPLESFKNALNRRAFNQARRLITWHEWGKESLVADYGVDPQKVVVIPPGVDLDKWKSARTGESSGPVRLLFVGGDFRRKGGDTLLKAFKTSLMQHCELDIVTRENVDTSGLTGVRVHHGLGPNSPDLMALYARADIFTFPTLADTLPLVNMEAMASGLPVITTTVGALREEIEDGVTGFLVAPGDAVGLAEATLRLVTNPKLRRDMSAAARNRADQRFNGSRNYPHVLAVCKHCVDAG
ncbi:MAG TPA: glycosyltransferase family 4 protein [Vicinamibacterales bacterium]|jgi:glycosyltransferase involved in cell wall biosynthesis|nr:glycosyltransferase family 4 protein [Vicinamibacterales bacterium]